MSLPLLTGSIWVRQHAISTVKWMIIAIEHSPAESYIYFRRRCPFWYIVVIVITFYYGSAPSYDVKKHVLLLATLHLLWKSSLGPFRSLVIHHEGFTVVNLSGMKPTCSSRRPMKCFSHQNKPVNYNSQCQRSSSEGKQRRKITLLVFYWWLCYCAFLGKTHARQITILMQE